MSLQEQFRCFRLSCGTTLLLALAVLVNVGCQKTSRPAKSPREAAEYSDLPGLAASPNIELQQELARLRQESMTPTQLPPQINLATAQPTAVHSKPDPPLVGIQQAYPPLTRSMLVDQSGQILPAGPLVLGPTEITRARELVERYALSRSRFPQSLPPLGRPLGWRMTDGMLTNLDFLDSITAGCRLELLAGLVALADGNPEDAIPSVEINLHAANLLAQQRHLTMRLTAARLRQETLALVQQIVAHPALTAAGIETILLRLDETLAAWPSDVEAWAGERAAALHAYELVRDGFYLSLLTPEEVARLEDRGVARTALRTIVNQVDDDELFYLHAVRRMLAACREPYFLRLPFLAQIRRELEQRSAEGRPAMLAQELLLTDFEASHRLLAEDLCRCEAWRLALAAALQRPLAEAPVNVLTGQPFSLERTAREVRLLAGWLKAPEPVTVPLRSSPNRGANVLAPRRS
jgi:hypothetical protein